MDIRAILALFLAATLTLTSATLASPRQSADERLEGQWLGQVTADVGQMEIEVTLTVSNGKAAGSIRTNHGEFVIKGGTFANGKWTLPFVFEGNQGRLVATLKGDTLAGDWINPGQAIGTFELKRRK